MISSSLPTSPTLHTGASNISQRIVSTPRALPRPLHFSRLSWRLARYYALLLAATLVGIGYGYYFSEVFFQSAKSDWVQTIFNSLKLLWLVPLPYAIINFYSFVRYPVILRASSPSITPLPGVRLVIRIVTRGKNPKLVAESAAIARHTLESVLRDDQWLIEVVSDNQLTIDEHNTSVIVVPQDYATPNRTRFKGRALHYALSHSTARDRDWIIHLDEETRFDADTVRAIHAFVATQNRRKSGHPAIGQGVILYGKKQIMNWLTTMGDSIRVGDDYGRFRLQFEHGKAWFGMHGSFVVINNAIEKQIGFDHGSESSITEDAFFALVAQAMDVKFQFIHTFMYEQSPFSIMDFIKQRRRWFGGLWLCALSPAVPLKNRLVLGTFMSMWSVSWLCLAMVYVNFLFPTDTPVWLAICGGVSFLYYVTLYLIGFFATYDRQQLGNLKFVALLMLQIVLIPVFSAMESGGVIYGLFSPPNDFYVVQKEVR